MYHKISSSSGRRTAVIMEVMWRLSPSNRRRSSISVNRTAIESRRTSAKMAVS
jgi:hypothetical protein